jgi:hypothetical protein
MIAEYHKIETLYERGENHKVIVSNFKNPVYKTINPWVWTEKIDGMNLGIGIRDGQFSIRGKSEKSGIPGDLLMTIRGLGLEEKLHAVFQCDVALYAEGYGAGIQKGGAYRKDKGIILFDVLVDNKWWLNDDNVRDVGSKLGLDVVPLVGVFTLEYATEYVRAGFCSHAATADPNAKAEGLVGRPVETLFDKKGERIIIKLKTKDF